MKIKVNYNDDLEKIFKDLYTDKYEGEKLRIIGIQATLVLAIKKTFPEAIELLKSVLNLYGEDIKTKEDLYINIVKNSLIIQEIEKIIINLPRHSKISITMETVLNDEINYNSYEEDKAEILNNEMDNAINHVDLIKKIVGDKNATVIMKEIKKVNGEYEIVNEEIVDIHKKENDYLEKRKNINERGDKK